MDARSLLKLARPSAAYKRHAADTRASAESQLSAASCSMKNMLPRHIRLALIVSTALLCSSCSFINNFVVINDSRAVLEVTYRMKPPNLPGATTSLSSRPPETLAVSQLDAGVPWQPLPSSRYKLEPNNNTVVLTLNPDEALLLTQCRPANGASSGDCEPDAFLILEIVLRGTNGEIKITGEQAHKTFVRNKNTYTLTYH